MGKIIGAIYLSIAFIFSLFHSHFGDHFDRGYFFNLGEAVVWPVTMFKSKGSLDGSSNEALAKSIVLTAQNLDMEERFALLQSIGTVQFYALVKLDPSVTEDYRAMAAQNGAGFLASKIYASPFRDKVLATANADLDGRSFHSAYAKAQSVERDIQDALAQNKMTHAIEAPVAVPAVNEPAVAPGPVATAAAPTGQWFTSFEQGTSEVMFRSERIELVVDCPGDSPAPQSFLTIDGREIEPSGANGTFNMVVDGTTYVTPFDTTDASRSGANFGAFWDRLRSASKVSVVVGSRREELSTVGLATAMRPSGDPAVQCKAA